MDYFLAAPTKEPAAELVERASPALRELFDFCEGEYATKVSPIRITGATGTGLPVLTGNSVMFNGPEPTTCETFAFGDVNRPPSLIDFCKTRQAPYGTIVKATLAILQHHCDDPSELLVSCDDRSKMGWVPALIILHELSGFDPDWLQYSMHELVTLDELREYALRFANA